MKSLVELQAQIESLQKQASAVRTKQYSRAVADIVANMRAFGISLDEVRKALAAQSAGRSKQAATATGRKLKAKATRTARPKKTRKPVPIKYKGPKGETWTGRGKQPVWLREQLKAGQAIEQFKV